METQKTPPPLRHGYISELARLARCTRQTATAALHKGTRGKKAERVRELYAKKYPELNQNNNQ